MSSRSRTRDSRITWLTPRPTSSRISPTSASASWRAGNPRRALIVSDFRSRPTLRHAVARSASPAFIFAALGKAACQPSPSSATRRSARGVWPPIQTGMVPCAGFGSAPLVGHAEELDLLLYPADAGAEDDATRRQVVERRQHLGGEDRMAVGQDEHGRAEPDALGHAGDEPERDQRLQEGGGRRQRKVAGRVVGIA